MKRLKNFVLTALIFCISFFSNHINAQQLASDNKSLNEKEKSIIIISSLAAKGDLDKLKTGLHEGLDAGLSVNEIKEVLVHLYAYCGFPRSIRGLQTFMEVLKDRVAKGIIDSAGKVASPITTENGKYERGKSILGVLTKMPQPNTLSGYSAFAPSIDTFLKEHLFADIFERDVLTYAQRELVTISVLATLQGVEPQLQSHISIGKNTGITQTQLIELADMIEKNISRTQANTVRKIINQPIVTIINTGMMVRISEIEIYPEYLEQYNTILKQEAAASVKIEQGVIAIFPMAQKENLTQIRIIEIYTDRTAYQSHLKTSHFQHYKTTTLKMVKSLKLIDMESMDKEMMLNIFKKLQ